MNSFVSMLKSTIGLKFIMAVTGLCLVFFTIAHASGNTLVFLGPDAINAYAHKLKSMPYLLWPARAGLLAIFLLHIVVALKLRRMNLVARPQNYAIHNQVQSTFTSRLMLPTGMILGTYVIFHLLHFTIGAIFVDRVDHETTNVFAMVVNSFQSPLISLAYIIAMGFLGMHLSHGIGSVLKSLGLSDPKYNRHVQAISLLLAALIVLAYVAIPIAVLCGFGKTTTTTAGL